MTRSRPLGSEEERGSTDYEPPKVIDRDVVASRHNSQLFGQHLASVAWSLGFFAAKRKAFVGDGQNWIWTEWERHFKPYGFVPILDFIHALTHIYAAAMAGRPIEQGWPDYVRWITAIWQGAIPFFITKIEYYTALFVSAVCGSILQDMGRGVQCQSAT